MSGDEPPRPVTAYGRSKLAAEQTVRRSNLSWSIVRPPIVYGPRDREVLKVFRLARLRIAPVFGDGAQELVAVHAEDLAAALIAVATSPATAGRTYTACHPEVFTSAEFGVAVAAAMGRSVTTLHIPQSVGRGRALTHRSGGEAGPPVDHPYQRTRRRNSSSRRGPEIPRPLTRDTGWRAAYRSEARPGAYISLVPGSWMAVTLPAQSSVRSAAEPLRPVDLILAAYLIVVSIVAALRLLGEPGRLVAPVGPCALRGAPVSDNAAWPGPGRKDDTRDLPAPPPSRVVQ